MAVEKKFIPLLNGTAVKKRFFRGFLYQIVLIRGSFTSDLSPGIGNFYHSVVQSDGNTFFGDVVLVSLNSRQNFRPNK